MARAICPLEACPSFDTGGDGRVAIDEIIAAVNDGLYGCPRDMALAFRLSLADHDE